MPDAAAIRHALAECMTLSDVDDAMGWARGTARKRRWRDPAAGGLPPADAELGGVALWFRATITRGFDLEDGQHVLAHVHGAWHPAVVASRDRRTVVVDYQRGPVPLGARRQRVTIDRVRPTDPTI